MSKKDKEFKIKIDPHKLFSRNTTRAHASGGEDKDSSSSSPVDKEGPSRNPSHLTEEVNPLDTTPKGSEIVTEDDTMAEAALVEIRDAFKEVASSNKLNDLRTITDLPYFGSTQESHNKNWVIDNCQEFLDHCEKATPDVAWNDAGRIRVLRRQLLGSSLLYFNDFNGVSWAEAKAFLLKMFPDPTTYASVSAEIERVKRRPGEQFQYLAIRIAKLYQKLQRVSSADLTVPWVEKSKKELLLKLCPGSIRNFVDVDADTYDELLKKIVDWLENNPQLKLTRLEIESEREKAAKTISNVQNQNKSNNPKGKQQDKSLPSEGGGEKEGSVSVVTQNANNSTNKVQVQNPTPVQNQNQGVDTYQNPGYGYGYGRGRGDFRGGFGGRGRGGRGGGRGDFRGGFGNRGRGGRGRGHWRGERNMGYNNDSTNEGSKDYSNYKCYVCSKMGHIARNCRNRPDNTTQGNQPAQPSGGGRNPNCWTCNGANHIARNCSLNRNFQ